MKLIAILALRGARAKFSPQDYLIDNGAWRWARAFSARGQPVSSSPAPLFLRTSLPFTPSSLASVRCSPARRPDPCFSLGSLLQAGLGYSKITRFTAPPPANIRVDSRKPLT